MKIALVGNQNSGKTTLFNLLTGSNQKIGNWPGVTIEHKEGIIKGTNYKLIDLPGIYSLSPYSLEEGISRKYIFDEKPDVIINIIDATSIERSLYLTTQLLELDVKVVIALNMTDILNKKGIEINIDKLSEELNVDIILISALKKTGIDQLIDLLKSNKIKDNTHKKIYSNDIEIEIEKIKENLTIPHKRFIAVKLLEKDIIFDRFQTSEIEKAINNIESKYENNIEHIIANSRYEYIVNIKNKAVNYIKDGESLTDKLDKIFLNKWLSLPIFSIIMFLIYSLAVGVIGQETVAFVEGFVARFSEWLGESLNTMGVSSWLISLVVDGILAGVGAVLSFIPQLIILFLCISLLETTGYMSRVAFILDKVFKKFGLSGKTLIPFIVGSGCSVPGIMATRTIEDQDERKMSIILTPFIPCSAKLPIIILFAGFFFGKYSGLVSASLYFMSIILILVSAVIMKKMFYKGQPSTFISELPEYKSVNIKYILKDVGEKTKEFINRAGTIILLCSVLLWFLMSFSWKFKYGVDVETSILASIGNAFAWFFYPLLGEWSWAATVSAIQGLVAKEQVVSSMAVIAGFTSEEGALIFNSGIFSFFTQSSAYAFMAFNLFSAPCFGAIAAMRRELGSVKKTLLAILFQTTIAWVLSFILLILINWIGVIF